MAVALQGAVIIKERGGLVAYKRKCERCGHVAGGSVTTGAVGSGIYRGGFRCPKCKKYQVIEIQGRSHSMGGNLLTIFKDWILKG